MAELKAVLATGKYSKEQVSPLKTCSKMRLNKFDAKSRDHMNYINCSYTIYI